MRLKDNRPDLHSRRGFTVVELVIVITIFSIAISGALVVGHQINKNRVSNLIFNATVDAYWILRENVSKSNLLTTPFGVAYADLFVSILNGKLDGFTNNGTTTAGIPALDAPIIVNNAAMPYGFLGGSYLFAMDKTAVLSFFGNESIYFVLSNVPQDICLRIASQLKTYMLADRSAETVRGAWFGKTDTSYQAIYANITYQVTGIYRFDAAACSSTYNQIYFVFSPDPT